jgi:predicted nucleotidyltransferase
VAFPRSVELPDHLRGPLTDTVTELRLEEGVQAIFLTGSVARGEADAFSDLDLSVLVAPDRWVRQDARYRSGVLVSVERSTAAQRARAFSDPETALWNLHSLRTGIAVHDPDGVFADLQARARAVRWADLAGPADARAGGLVADTAEELHKVMGGLSGGDDSRVAYGALGLTLALGKAALLSTGTLLPSENRFLLLAQEAWTDPPWRAAYGVLTGLTEADLRGRGRAALDAYLRAVTRLRWSAGPHHDLAHEAARRAETFLARSLPSRPEPTAGP